MLLPVIQYTLFSALITQYLKLLNGNNSITFYSVHNLEALSATMYHNPIE